MDRLRGVDIWIMGEQKTLLMSATVVRRGRVGSHASDKRRKGGT